MVGGQKGGAADPNVGSVQPLADPGPFKTNDQRRVESAERQERFEKRIADKSNANTGTGSDKPQISRGASSRPQDNPFVNLQIYNPIKPPMPPRPTEAVVPNPYQIPVLGFDPRNYMGNPYGAPPMTMPLAYQPLQNYTIDINGINASYSKLNRVMQDQLPDRDTLDTMTTISERKRLLDFIRTVFIKVSDGEMSSLGDSNNAMSLLSRLKFVDLNPYHYDPVNRNPLRSLPYGYLVYRTAYPLRYDPSNISVRAAQDSTGINVRLYRLSVDSLRARHIQYDTTSNSRKLFDVWRELDWYEDVRQNVIAAGRSPHLTMMYCWMIAPCTIDWDALRRAGNSINITTGQLDAAVTRALKPLVPVATQSIVVDAAGRVGARQVMTEAPTSHQQPNSNAPLPTKPLGSAAMTLGMQTLGIGTPARSAIGNVTSVQNPPGNGTVRTINGVRTTGQLINGIWTPGQVINGKWTPGQVIAGVWTPGQFVNGVWTHADGTAVQPTNVGTAYTTALGLQNRTSITDQFGQTLLMPNNITNAPLVQTVHGDAIAVIRPAPQDSGYCAIAMTDASTHNMVAWSSIAYDREFHFSNMSNTGSHSDTVWFNVLFQVLHGMHTMQLRGYSIAEMTLARNFYIKDLKIDPAAACGYWRYRINNINYYLPNLGYMVLIDSAFYDPTPNTHGDPDRRRGIRMANPDIASDELKAVRLINYENLVSLLSNSFTAEFTHRNGVLPSPAVRAWIDKVVGTLNDPTFKTAAISDDVNVFRGFERLFTDHATKFMHNRIGKHIRISERPYLRENEPRVFKRGQMLAYEYQYDTYVWVQFMEIRTETVNDPDLGVNFQRTYALISTRDSPDDPDIVQRKVSLESLIPYANSEVIQQDFNPDEHRLSDTQLLETYICE